MHIVSIVRGDFLFRAGDEANGFYIVRHGELEIRIDHLVYETNIVGEMSVVDESTRSASVLARTRAELIAVDPPGFLALVENTPAFALTVMRIMARRLRQMNRRYEAAQPRHSASR